MSFLNWPGSDKADDGSNREQGVFEQHVNLRLRTVGCENQDGMKVEMLEMTSREDSGSLTSR